MLDRIVRAAIESRLLIVLALAALVVGAFMLVPKINLDAFPDVTNVQVTVNTEVNGLAASEVEQLVTYPIEATMYALPDVVEVRSISKVGVSVVTVVFKEGTDIYLARQLVFQQVQEAREKIPSSAGVPEIGANTSGLGKVLQYALYSKRQGQHDLQSLRSVNDWIVKPLLTPTEGVTQVLSFGGHVRQYQVNIDPSKLLGYKLTVDEVKQALENNNRNAGGWYQERDAQQLVVRGVGWMRPGAQGLEDVSNTPVKESQGVIVHIRDVAHVAFGGEIRQGATTLMRRDVEGRPVDLGEVVTGQVYKRSGANTNATITALQARLPLVRKALPPGVGMVVFYDQASLVQKAVSTVESALIEAFVLIVAVLILFLMNLRAAMLVLVSVPISIAAALMLMAWFNVSANLMSLGGLAIAIGIIVDGSVVMMENIFSHLTHPPEKPAASLGEKDFRLRIEDAAREVAIPVFFAVLIIVVVFAPLFSLEGVEGKLFKPMALSIVFALSASLIVALMVIPALATYLFGKGLRHRDSFVLAPIEAFYRKLLPWILSRPKTVVAAAGGAFVVSLLMMPFLGTEFVPVLEEGTINIETQLAPAANLKTTLEVTNRMSQIIMKFPEVTYVTPQIGRAELSGDPEGVNFVEVLVGLKPIDEWQTATTRDALSEKMKEALSVIPGTSMVFTQPIADRVDELLSGVRGATLAIKLFGPDLEVLAKKGEEIEALTQRVRGTRDVALERTTGEAQLTITPNRDILNRHGISVSDVMDLVQDAIGGTAAGQIINGNVRYDVYVRLAEQFRNSPGAIQDLVLRAPNGAIVRAGDIASVEIGSGPPEIRRDDVQRRVVIKTNLEGRDLGGLVEELRQRIASEIKLPPGYTVVFGGQFENQQRAQARLMIVVPVSLALIFLLLYFAFGYLGQAALIMINVPLALIGGVAALLLSGTYLSVPGSIGFIALFGVAVLNGVVMVNAINQRLSKGGDLLETVQLGALSRLRPVLMTATITALGLIPLLLSQGVGSEIQRPLATVVIGGLVTSTLLTLVVLPAAYPWFSRGLMKDRTTWHQ